MIRPVLIAAAVCMMAACTVTPQAVPPGPVASTAGFEVTLKEAWSRWPDELNMATRGEMLTKDGMLLNRLHLAKVKADEPWVRAAKNADVPRFRAAASEIETVDFIVASLKRIGYSEMEASSIRPETLDGQAGVRFELNGKWENGLDVRGDAAFIPSKDELKLVVFLAPELHYYEASSAEVAGIIGSVNLP
ncbi:hypothetical protein [Hyphomonas sp.]|uniref:hypothetical protein n=1 Tax=Hyphomonas sp. TaxID=87 RepID=UPI00391A2321